MKTLIDYLEMVGQATGKEILEWMGERWDTTELFLMVEQGKVSSSYGRHGARYFRYPAVESVEVKKREKRGEDKTDLLLEYIQSHPMSNGQEIKKGLGLSQEAFDIRKERLLGQGLIIQSKEGRAFLYRVKPDLKPVGKPGAVDSQVRKPDPFANSIPMADMEDGRFMKERHERELSELDQKIIEQVELYPDDREIDNMAEDCDVGPEQRKAYMRSLSKLFRDGYIGKVVEGDNVMYCSIERV